MDWRVPLGIVMVLVLVLLAARRSSLEQAIMAAEPSPGLHSLALNGTSAYAEVPHSTRLNLTGDWTVEAWFKDEDPNGFNHDFRQILMKGDRDAVAEAPYYVLVGRKSILAGVRTGGQDYPITWDLVYAGLDPKLWHHVAVSFRSDLNVLNLWLDGKHIHYLQVPARSTAGNTLPLEIGRNGPATGKYWLGKLRDVRLWSTARSGADISANFHTRLSGPVPGLVANWRFDDGAGTLAADRLAGSPATLLGGAEWSSDVPGLWLEGNPAALAVATDMEPVPAPEADLGPGVIMTRLDVGLAPGATVGQVNQALSSINAGIVSMRSGLADVTVAIPNPGSLQALGAVIRHLQQSPGIDMVLPGVFSSPLQLPPPPADTFTSVGHLFPTRFPAAWNASQLAQKGCESRKVQVVVPDHFDPARPASFDSHVPGFQTAYAPIHTTDHPLHGYDVTTTLAGVFGAVPPIGAMPFPRCLTLTGLPLVSGFSMEREVGVIQSHFPAGKFILNYSSGFGAKQSASCDPSEFDPSLTRPRVVLPSIRAAGAALWKEATRDRWADFLAVAAAGNDRDECFASIYPGAATAAYSSIMNVAATPDPLFGFVLDANLWVAHQAGYPSLSADPADKAELDQFVRDRHADGLRGAPNVLSVGATFKVDDRESLVDAGFSDSQPDLRAVGQGVATLGSPDQGTSFSAPQVAGLAAYLWLLSDDLRNQPAPVTRQLLVDTAHTDIDSGGGPHLPGIVDAYEAVLSLDKAELPTPASAAVRNAILDVDGDGIFSISDMVILLSHFVDPASGTPVVPNARDYSRFDLNGDGFTGGSGTAEFDLDRVGSARFSKPNLSGRTIGTPDVLQTIEGVPVHFDELKVTDLNVLCYYAYSGLFQGNDADKAQRADMLGYKQCLNLQLTADFPATIDPGTGTPLTLKAACGAPVVCDSAAAGLQIDLAVNGGTADVVGGVTDAGGFFRTRVTPADGSTSVSIRIRSHRPDSTTLLSDNTLAANVTTGGCGRVLPQGFLIRTRADVAAIADVRDFGETVLEIGDSGGPDSVTSVTLPCLTGGPGRTEGRFEIRVVSRTLQRLSLPNLAYAADILIGNFSPGASAHAPGNPQLVSVDAPKLQSIGFIQIQNNPQLSRLTIGPARTVPGCPTDGCLPAGLLLSDNPALASLDGIDSGLHLRDFDFAQPLGLGDSALLAFANRITVTQRVCKITDLAHLVSVCFPGPPWRLN